MVEKEKEPSITVIDFYSGVCIVNGKEMTLSELIKQQLSRETTGVGWARSRPKDR